jgi:hypothetical protein
MSHTSWTENGVLLEALRTPNKTLVSPLESIRVQGIAQGLAREGDTQAELDLSGNTKKTRSHPQIGRRRRPRCYAGRFFCCGAKQTTQGIGIFGDAGAKSHVSLSLQSRAREEFAEAGVRT